MYLRVDSDNKSFRLNDEEVGLSTAKNVMKGWYIFGGIDSIEVQHLHLEEVRKIDKIETKCEMVIYDLSNNRDRTYYKKIICNLISCKVEKTTIIVPHYCSCYLMNDNGKTIQSF